MATINLENGDFYINEDIVISRDTSYLDVLKLAPLNEIWDIGNGYKWIYFKEVDIDNLLFKVDICFHNNKRYRINFGFTTQQQKNISWTDWNESDELKRKDIYEEWLTNKFGKKRNYSWGKISANYDPRGGTTFMNIYYR